MAQISDYRTGNTATYMGSNTPPRLFSDCHALDNSSYISPEYFIFSGTRHDPRSCTHTELVLRTIKGLRSKPSFWVSASSAQLTSIWADLARSSRAARDKDGWRGGDHQTLRVDNLVNAPKPPPPKKMFTIASAAGACHGHGMCCSLHSMLIRCSHQINPISLLTIYVHCVLCIVRSRYYGGVDRSNSGVRYSRTY